MDVLLTFISFLNLVTYLPVDGLPKVIGSSQPIMATLGDDVILPCHVEPLLNVEELTVMWWRPDVPLDPVDPLSKYKYVHRYHKTYDVEDLKMRLYAGRTALVKGELKHGNVSLKITNVKLSDQGRYRCHIPQLGSATIVKLVVDPNSVKKTTPQHSRNLQTPDPANERNVKGGRSHLITLIPAVLICVFLILRGGFGYLLKTTKSSEVWCHAQQPTSSLGALLKGMSIVDVRGFKPAAPPATSGPTG